MIYIAIWFGSVVYNLYLWLESSTISDEYFINAFYCVVIGLVGMFPFHMISQKIKKDADKKEAQEIEKEREKERLKEEKERLKEEKEEEEKEKERLKEEKEEEEKEEKERQNEIKKLCELHGDEFGEAVYNNELRVGMDKPAVTESWGDSGLKKRSKWYYPSGGSLNIVYFKSSKVSEIVEDSDPFELDMEKDEVIALWGEPEDEKKTVYKTKTKLRWYYFSRTTRQYSTAYRYHVDLEDDKVVGWKELE